MVQRLHVTRAAPSHLHRLELRLALLDLGLEEGGGCHAAGSNLPDFLLYFKVSGHGRNTKFLHGPEHVFFRLVCGGSIPGDWAGGRCGDHR